MRAAMLALAATIAAADPSPCFAQRADLGTRTGSPAQSENRTIVINPTEQECKRGWRSDLRWTKQEFKAFCTRLGASK
jgi:hypothetical protein